MDEEERVVLLVQLLQMRCPHCGVDEHRQCRFWYDGCCCCHNTGPQPFGECPPSGCSCSEARSAPRTEGNGLKTGALFIQGRSADYI
jgi:hypothetical protein